MYFVKDIMTAEVVSIHPNAPIEDAITCMFEHNISGLPVVEDDNYLVGVITEIDIIELVYKADIGDSKVRDHMSRQVCVLEADSSLDSAASLFCSRSYRRVPVVREGHLVGIISRRDLIRFLHQVCKRRGQENDSQPAAVESRRSR